MYTLTINGNTIAKAAQEAWLAETFYKMQTQQGDHIECWKGRICVFQADREKQGYSIENNGSLITWL